MEAATLTPSVRMRGKRQFTLPISIARQAQISENDKFLVSYSNGAIVLLPAQKKVPEKTFDLMSYGGICAGMWGKTTEETNQFIRDLRS